MNSDFTIGLQITGLGMGLVFLTLIIIMLAIMLLDRVFRLIPAMEEASEGARAPVPEGGIQPARPEVSGEEDLDQVAAIAVALAYARQADLAPGPRAKRRWPTMEEYPQLPPEVVRVIRVEPGPSNWCTQGRITALR